MKQAEETFLPTSIKKRSGKPSVVLGESRISTVDIKLRDRWANFASPRWTKYLDLVQTVVHDVE